MHGLAEADLCPPSERSGVAACAMVPFLGALIAVACALPTHALRSGASNAQSLKVTPVEKVISLLGQLSKQVQEEGKNEAAEYDKYACFCKEQADQKTYAIDKSNEKIDALQAKITALDTEIADLNSDVSSLTTRITAIEGEISNETSARQAENAQYLIEDENVTAAIAAVEGAIETMKSSKAQLSGAKLNLAQVRDVLSTLPAASLATVSALLERGSGGQPAYTYNSNDIISLLQTLLMQFKARKKSIFDDEHQLKSISEKRVLGLSNEKTFKEKEKVQKEAIVGEKTTAKETATQEKTDETTARDADVDFRNELTTQCQDKATEWDQRSQARAGELTAISEAMEVLKSGVNPNYGANKKLVGIQQKVAIHTGQDRAAAKKVPLSFVQESEHHRGSGSAASAAAKHVLQLLDAAGVRLHSPALAALASKVALRADNFVKVRGLIRDLITRLESEATSEATQKSFCDTEMARAISSRDAEKLAMEQQAALRTEKEAEKAQLTEEIALLSREIADLSKALNEATELRSGERLDNEKTVADATAGKAAVEEAIRILQNFYGTTLVQSAQPNADRTGSTVADLAPATSYSGDYAGKTQASTGIFGLLQVILDDFDRTISTVGTAESGAASEFTTFESTTQSSITTKRGGKETKGTAITTTETEITAAQDAYMQAERQHKMAIEEISSLEAMCVEGEESWAERKAKREQEIAALKQALQILEDWQN
mmetsp:Transcript_75168/g.220353  ORF Transcript_75168/g.220353 Transcript_75168/m.220353 type:complete len:722 (+) Transcript_75168:2-2167(+)